MIVKVNQCPQLCQPFWNRPDDAVVTAKLRFRFMTATGALLAKARSAQGSGASGLSRCCSRQRAIHGRLIPQGEGLFRRQHHNDILCGLNVGLFLQVDIKVQHDGPEVVD